MSNNSNLSGKPAWMQQRAPVEMDPATLAYIDFNRRRWQYQPADADTPIVLTSHFFYRPVVHAFSYFANYLANQHGGVPRGYCLDEYLYDYLDQIYDSFGARLDLSFANGNSNLEVLQAKARQTFENLKSKEDVVQLRIEGLQIGDLIYNWYCRRNFRPAVDLKDEFLYELILQGHIIYQACSSYLRSHKVVAILPNHTFYMNCGILTRLAIAQGIPVYLQGRGYAPSRIPPYLRPDGWPENSKRSGPYYKYSEIFQTLSPATQAAGLQRGKAILEERLGGIIDTKVLLHTSAWGEKSTERALGTDTRPKIVIFAHDFCDSVHKFRGMIFSDFYEWLNLLLSCAEKTPYDWYLKPHPNLLLEEKNILNRKTLKELIERYPKITLLTSGISNAQLLEEGVSAVFTVHGTIAHEYAYRGIPVVNAGDNLHCSFNFNFHASNLEEYKKFIADAGHLKIDINKEEIQQFCYMHYCDQYRTLDGAIDHPEAQFLAHSEVRGFSGTPEFFSHVLAHSTEKTDWIVTNHFDRYLKAGMDGLGRYEESF